MLPKFTVNHWSVFFSFTVAYFLSQFFRSANAVIAPTLVHEFALDSAALGMMTSVFFATFAITQFPLGIALDRWGARSVTAGLMLVAVAGSLLFAFGSSLLMLTFGRALLGIGLAGILMGGLKAFSQWFPEERFGSMTGLLTGFGATGGLVATTPMAWLNEQVGWRAIFMGGALLAGIAVLLIAVCTRNQPADALPTTNERVQINLPTIFRSMSFWRIAAPVAWVAGFGLAWRGLWAGPYLFNIYHQSDIEVGNLLLLMGIGGIAGSILAGWLTDRIGIASVVMSHVLILIACQAILASLPPLPVVTVVYVTMGLAGGFPVALLAQARKIFPPHMTGQVLSMVNMTGFAGTFLLQWWVGETLAFLPTMSGQFGGDISLPQAYSVVLTITAVVSMLTLVGYMPLARPQPNIVPASPALK